MVVEYDTLKKNCISTYSLIYTQLVHFLFCFYWAHTVSLKRWGLLHAKDKLRAAYLPPQLVLRTQSLSVSDTPTYTFCYYITPLDTHTRAHALCYYVTHPPAHLILLHYTSSDTQPQTHTPSDTHTTSKYCYITYRDTFKLLSTSKHTLL